MNKINVLILLSAFNIVGQLFGDVSVDGLPSRGPFHALFGVKFGDLSFTSDAERVKQIKEALESKNFSKVKELLDETTFVTNKELIDLIIQSNEPTLLEFIRSKGVSIKNYFGHEVLDEAIKHNAYAALKNLVEKHGFLDDFVKLADQGLYQKAVNELDAQLMAVIVAAGLKKDPKKFDVMLKEMRATVEKYADNEEMKKKAVTVFEAYRTAVYEILNLDEYEKAMYALIHDVMAHDEKHVFKEVIKDIVETNKEVIHVVVDDSSDTLGHQAVKLMHKEGVKLFADDTIVQQLANAEGKTPEKLAHENLSWCNKHSQNALEELELCKKCERAEEIVALLKTSAAEKHKEAVKKIEKEKKELYERKKKLLEEEKKKLEQEREDLKKKLEQEFQEKKEQLDAAYQQKVAQAAQVYDEFINQKQ